MNETKGIEELYKLLSQKYVVCGVMKGTKGVKND